MSQSLQHGRLGDKDERSIWALINAMYCRLLPVGGDKGGCYLQVFWGDGDAESVDAVNGSSNAKKYNQGGFHCILSYSCLLGYNSKLMDNKSDSCGFILIKNTSVEHYSFISFNIYPNYK